MPKTARAKAVEAYSKYIRVKECLETTKLPFCGVCFTCGRQFHINALDAGHYVSGKRNTVLFEENNTHIQCKYWCNIMNHGNTKKYKKRLIARYGIEEVERLKALKHKVVEDKDMDFEEIEKKYKQKLTDLKGH